MSGIRMIETTKPEQNAFFSYTHYLITDQIPNIKASFPLCFEKNRKREIFNVDKLSLSLSLMASTASTSIPFSTSAIDSGALALRTWSILFFFFSQSHVVVLAFRRVTCVALSIAPSIYSHVISFDKVYTRCEDRREKEEKTLTCRIIRSFRSTNLSNLISSLLLVMSFIFQVFSFIQLNKVIIHAANRYQSTFE